MRTPDLVKRLLVGRALSSQQLHETLLPKWLALPVFASDPLSSVAYATEEIVLVLASGGAAYLVFSKWVAAVIAALLVIVVLAVALILVRQGLMAISEGLATLASALSGVESEHLRPLEPAVKAINAQFDIILGAMPGIARKAAGNRSCASAQMASTSRTSTGGVI